MKNSSNRTTFSKLSDDRVMMIDGEPWFVGKDVAKALGYKKERNALAAHVDREDKKDAPIQGDLGGKQNMTLINESGLYSLILSSKLDSARQFKRWVTSEVLPSIRKTGSYSVKDVATALGYKNLNRDVNRHVDAEDRKGYRIGTPSVVPIR